MLAEEAHLFPVEAIAANQGAIVDYYLKAAATKPAITVHDAAGGQVGAIEATAYKGLNRGLWNPREGVVAGTYTVRLTIGGRTLEQPLEVRAP